MSCHCHQVFYDLKLQEPTELQGSAYVELVVKVVGHTRVTRYLWASMTDMQNMTSGTFDRTVFKQYQLRIDE